MKPVDCFYNPTQCLVLVNVGRSDHKCVINLWSRLCPVQTLVIFLPCRNAAAFLEESWEFPGLLNSIVQTG